MSTDHLGDFTRALRADPARALVALDFDGTLAPLVADPEQARLLPGVADVLGSLGRAGVGLALVTGRAPRTVLELSGLADLDGLGRLRVAGLYGLQVLDAATGDLTDTVDEATRAAVAAVRAELPDLLATAAPGVHLEDKGLALVVHTRPAADPQQALDELLPAVRELADRHGLRHEPGRFAAEIRPDGSDKGATLLRLLDATATATTTATRAVLYAGDDTGDLPALRAIPGLRDRGLAAVGIAVVQDGTDPDVPAAADVGVDGPRGLLELLRGLLARQ